MIKFDKNRPKFVKSADFVFRVRVKVKIGPNLLNRPISCFMIKFDKNRPKFVKSADFVFFDQI